MGEQISICRMMIAYRDDRTRKLNFSSGLFVYRLKFTTYPSRNAS